MAFDFQFSNEAKEQEEALWQEAETRLSKLGVDRKEVIGASVNIKKDIKAQTPYLFRVNIILQLRPKNIVAEKKNKNAMMALKEALEVVERQYRKTREKKRDKSRGRTP